MTGIHFALKDSLCLGAKVAPPHERRICGLDEVASNLSEFGLDEGID